MLVNKVKLAVSSQNFFFVADWVLLIMSIVPLPWHTDLISLVLRIGFEVTYSFTKV